MIHYCMLFSRHPNLLCPATSRNQLPLSPLECAVPRFRPVTPLECAVTKIRSGKSFRMRSSEKRWGVPLSRCCAEVGGFEVQDAGQVKEEKRAARSMRFE